LVAFEAEVDILTVSDTSADPEVRAETRAAPLNHRPVRRDKDACARLDAVTDNDVAGGPDIEVDSEKP